MSLDASASASIARPGLVWKQRPGAWKVEPPVSSSGPWSSTTTFLTPIRVR